MITNPEIEKLCTNICDSYLQLSGSPILETSCPDLPEALYNAKFILIAHGTEVDPIFNFANLEAQKLWEMDWNEFTRMPSRLSAPENLRAGRQKLLDQASSGNIITGFNGVRVSRTGKLFEIRDVTLWNVFDSENQPAGQAAKFSPEQVLPLPADTNRTTHTRTT
ncbi:MAG: MEKHLA domain-containing protein [Methyloligellaceae bacterium]